MADPLYHLTRVWGATSAEGTYSGYYAHTYLNFTGGLVFPDFGGTGEWSWDVIKSPTIGATGIVFTSDKSLDSSYMPIFGSHKGGATSTFRYGQRFPCAGTLECKINITTLPTTIRYLLDFLSDGSYGPGMACIQVAANTGELRIKQGNSADQSTGLYLTTGNNHFFYQIDDVVDDYVPRLTLGVNGTAKRFLGLAIGYPSTGFTFFNCARSVPTGLPHTTHGLACTARDIRYTHLKSRYPQAVNASPYAYTQPTTPYDIAAPTPIVVTLASSASYSGPAVIVPESGNARPTTVELIRQVTDVSGGTGPYTYRWYDYHFGGYGQYGSAGFTTDTITLDLSTHGLQHTGYRVLCVVTDSTGVVGVSAETAIEITEGAVYVPDTGVYHNGTQPIIVTAEPLGYGGVFGDAKNWDEYQWTVTGGITGAQIGDYEYGITNPDIGIDGATLTLFIGDYYYEPEFELAGPSGTGTVYVLVGAGAFWTEYERTEEPSNYIDEPVFEP